MEPVVTKCPTVILVKSANKDSVKLTRNEKKLMAKHRKELLSKKKVPIFGVSFFLMLLSIIT